MNVLLVDQKTNIIALWSIKRRPQLDLLRLMLVIQLLQLLGNFIFSRFFINHNLGNIFQL